jgi:hypothetical protein
MPLLTLAGRSPGDETRTGVGYDPRPSRRVDAVAGARPLEKIETRPLE